MTTSEMLASKLVEANCSTRLSSRTSKLAMIARAWLTSPRCSIITPFGVPVEPEV